MRFVEANICLKKSFIGQINIVDLREEKVNYPTKKIEQKLEEIKLPFKLKFAINFLQNISPVQACYFENNFQEY